MNNRQIGKSCESYICNKLLEDKYKIIARNFHLSKSPEIDIIAQKDNILHFIEVKARSGVDYGLPCEAVSDTKMAKIRKSSELFIKKEDMYDMELSYDVAEVFFKMNKDECEIININIIYGAF